MPRPSSATIIAFVALFALLASTAVAAGLQKNSVTNKSIRKNAVTGAKVKNSSLTGDDIKGNSLTGSDIKESTLGEVPNADNADKIGGLSASQLTTNDRFVTSNNFLAEGQELQIMSFGPFGVTARCVTNNPGVVPWMRVTTTGSNAYSYVQPGNGEDSSFSAPEVKNSQLGPASAVQDKSPAGSFDLMDPASGMVVQGSVHAYLNYGGENCRFVGYATVARP